MMPTKHLDLIDDVCRALRATPTGTAMAPWDEIAHLPDGTAVGIVCVSAREVTTAFVDDLDRVAQDVQLSQGLVVAEPALTDDALALLDLSTITAIEVTSLQDIKDRAKRRAHTTVLGTDRSQGLPEALKEVRRRLLNLTSTNVLISLKDNKTTLYLDGSDPHIVYQALVRSRGESEVLTTQEPVPRGPRGPQASALRCSLERSTLDTRLRTIEREFQDRITGRGLNELYVALGCLSWTDGIAGKEDAKIREAPLVLAPLTIERERIVVTEEIPPEDPAYRRPGQTREVARYRYRLGAEDAAPRENPSLILKLEQEYEIALPTLESFTDEDGAINLEGYLDGVAASIRRQPETAHWQVLPKVVVGFFSYAKAVMEEDLNLANWAKEVPGMHLLEAALMGSPPVEQTDIGEADVEAAQTRQTLVTIDDSDSSQTKAILMVDQGRDVVIQGPPGTGKSQTITNLIAHAMASGKRVLFVSEKRAALEVVRSRLTRRGLGDFLLPLHDTKLGSKEMQQVLKRRLMTERPRENTYTQDVGKVAQAAGPLSALAETLRLPMRPDLGPTKLLWATSALRTSVTALRTERGLGPIIDACRLSAPIDRETELLAEEICDELAILEGSGLFHRCDCWTGFLVVPLDTSACQHLGRALDVACNELNALDAASQIFRDRYWPWDERPWKDCCQLVDDIIKLSSPASITQTVDQIFKALGSARDLGQRAEAFLRATQAERALATQITTALGSLPDERWMEQISAEVDGPAPGAFLADRPVKDVYQLAERLRDELPHIQQLFAEITETARRLAYPSVTSQTAWINLAAVLDGVAAAPSDLAQTLGAHQALPAFVATIDRIRDEVTATRSAKAALARVVVWEDVPQDEQVLLRLRQDLRVGHGTWTAWLPWGRYAKARRACRAFQADLAQGRQAVPDLLRALTEIPAVRARLRRLDDDQDAKSALGTVFQGQSTALDRLSALRDLVSLASASCPYAALAPMLTNLGMLAKDPMELRRLASVCRESLTRVADLEAQMDAVTPAQAHTQPTANQDILFRRLENTAACGEGAAPFLRLHNLTPGLTWGDAWQSARRMVQLQQQRTELQAMRTDLHLPAESIQAEAAAQELIPWHALLGGMPIHIATWLCQQGPDMHTAVIALQSELTTVQQHFRALDSQVLATFQQYSRVKAPSWPSSKRPMADLRTSLGQCRDQVDDLPGWSRIVAITTRVEAQPGLSPLVTAVLRQDPPVTVDEARTIWALARYEADTRSLLDERTDLKTFDRARHEARRQSFAKHDKALTDSAVVQVVDCLLKRRPPEGNAVGRVADKTEMSLVRHELEKTRAFIPVRSLVQRAGRSLQTLMPCWMMSPLSVSWYLPRDGFQFDLVIMDEASQIRPEDAMGALMRAKQAVIVGDTKQMPPDRTFDSGSKLDGLFTASSMESVLALAENCGRFSHSMLRWHYRSRHQSLIAFSNEQYYDGNLMVFPSPHRQQGAEGITHVYLPKARYHKQLNPQEADAVIDQLLQHATRNLALPKEQRQSVGVAAMNAAQRDLILDLLDHRCARDAKARHAIDALQELPEPLFIQNLENIQGDERDNILISFTYGPDEASGVVMQRFGPILQAGGERRLNVLFTRARVRLTAITSMRSTDIKATPASSRGHRDLQAYLAYVESGRMPQDAMRTKRSGTHDSAFEREVASAISDLGLKWESQVGVAGYFVDLGIYDPEQPSRFLVGIECDGASYHSSRVARDRDRLREEVLRSRGWDIYRIWSTDWFQNRSIEVDRLRRHLKSVLSRPTRH